MNLRVGKIKSNTMMVNSVYSLSAKAVTMIFFFVFDILCARILETDAYGEWVYFYAIITIIYSVVWFGVNVSSKIFIAKAETSKRMEIFASALLLRLIVSLVLTLIYLIIVFAMWRIQLFDVAKYAHLPQMLLLGSSVVFLNSCSEFFKEIFVGFIDFKALLVISSCEYAGYFVFGLAGLLISKSVYCIIFGFLISLLLTVLVGFWIILNNYHLEKTHFRREIIISEGKNIFKYAKYIALSGIGAILLTEIDTFMLGYFREGYDTAVYSIAKQISSKAIHVNLALSTSMMPVFANITVENVKAKKKQFKKVMFCNAAVTFGITIFLALLGNFAIRILYGEKYLFAAKVLYFLLPYYVMSSFSKFLVLFLDYQNKAKVRSIVFFMTIVFDIILNAVLIPGFGAVGASVATDLALTPYLVFLFLEAGIIFKEYHKRG